MIPWLKGLLYDPNSFANVVRCLVFAVGEGAAQLGPSSEWYWAGHVVQILSLAIRAGDRNLPRLPSVAPPS